jgi:hypothetical protein
MKYAKIVWSGVKDLFRAFTSKKALKFNAKLLTAVAIGSILLYWGTTAAIYAAGEKVANAYTSEAPLFR